MCAVLWVATGTAANCLALATMVRAPRRGGVPPRGAYRGGRRRRAGLLPPRRQADAGRWRRRQADARRYRRADRPDPQRRAPGPAPCHRDHAGERIWPRLFPRRTGALGAWRKERRLGLHMDGARFANAAAFLGGSPGGRRQRPGRQRSPSASSRTAGWDAEAVVLFDPEPADRSAIAASAPGTCNARAAIWPRRSSRCWRTGCGSPMLAARQRGGGTRLRRGCGRAAAPPGRGERAVRAPHRRRARALRRAGFRLLRLGRDSARFVTAWNTRMEDAQALGKAIAAL
jgi:threonine aldolase